MQDLYRDLEERLQELSNLSSVSNLLVRHVPALPGDSRALSPGLNVHEGGLWWLQAWDELVMLPSSESCCSTQRSKFRLGGAGRHASSSALVTILQEQLSPAASRRQPWPACCTTRQAVAEARVNPPGSACDCLTWCDIHLLAVLYPGSPGWSAGGRAWH